MIDFITGLFRKLWDLISWVFFLILSLIGQILSAAWWLVEQIADILWSLVLHALNVLSSTLINLYVSVALDYPGVTMAILPIAWLVHKKWTAYNAAHNIDPPEFWKRPAFVTIIGTPLAIALIAKVLPTSPGSIPSSSPLVFFPALNNPLIATSFTLLLFFAGYSLLVRFGVIKASHEPALLRIIVHYSFAITLTTVVAGFGLAAFQAYRAS